MANEGIFDRIAGGKILETKDGRFAAVPSDTLVFGTKAEAEAAGKALEVLEQRAYFKSAAKSAGSGADPNQLFDSLE